MIINNNTATVEVSASSQAHGFSIAVNAKAFKVLSSTLYQNKQGSIVRELCTNALDSHVMAGKSDVAFEVHAPDAFEPYFAVKDFGVGLSEEDVKSIFTVFFQSTKDQSNDVTGSFGLGSKTPFSYVDQFTIESIHNGTKTLYSAFISESGLPNIIAMHNEPVDASSVSNGVEIKVPVKKEDFWKFKDEIKTQLKHFKVKPVIKNADIQFVNQKFVFESKNIAVVADERGYYNCTVVQGGVGYPLEWNMVSDKLDEDNRNFFKKLFTDNVVNLYFNIGEIGVTASREGIEYDTHTIANINKKIAIASKELSEYVKTALDTKQTDFEKVCLYNDSTLLQKFGNIVKQVGSYKVHNVYGGKLALDVADMLPEYTIRKMNSRNKLTYIRYLEPSVKTTILIKDTSEKEIARLSKFKLENLNKDYAYISYVGKNTALTKQNIIDAIGGDSNIVWLSDIAIEDKVKTPTVRTVKSQKTSYYVIDSINGSLLKQTRQFDDLSSIVGNTVYFLTKGASFCDDNLQVENMIRSLRCAEKFAYFYNPKLKINNIVAVNVRDIDTVKALGNFKEAKEYIAEVSAVVSKDVKLIRKVERSHVFSNLDYDMRSYLQHAINYFGNVPQDNKFSKMVEIAAKYRNYSLPAKDQETITFMRLNGIGQTGYVCVHRISNMVVRRINKSPVLKLCAALGWDRAKHTIGTVKMIEEINRSL